jgi:hypothetical protein
MTTTTQKKTTTKSKPSVTTEKKDSPIAELPSNPFVFEVFNLAMKQKSIAKKVEVLQKYSHPSIQTLFVWNFDESIVSALPVGEVPYASVGEQNSFSGTITEKIDDAVYKMKELGSNSLGSQDQGRSSIPKEYQKFYNFVKGGNDSLSSLRRETMFINLLQGLHPLEAEILCLVKDKKLETKYKITKEIASQSYPNIQWGGRS